MGNKLAKDVARVLLRTKNVDFLDYDGVLWSAGMMPDSIVSVCREH